MTSSSASRSPSGPTTRSSNDTVSQVPASPRRTQADARLSVPLHPSSNDENFTVRLTERSRSLRPSLEKSDHPNRPLPRPFSYKSSNAVPTLSTASALSSGATTPTRHGNSGVRSSRSSSMAAHDREAPHTAADLLRQAMMQR